jgi:uracil-DNA glycosylase family 4
MADEAQVPLDDSLSSVEEEVRSCEKCPLSLTRTNAVPGEGPADARVVLIGEGPGRNEDAQGRPFVGAAGRQLDALLGDAGLRRGDVYITNVVKCRPPENRRPTVSEADACRPYLERQLGLVRPKLVVLLGDTALKRFFPEESLPSAHGKTVERGGLAFFPTYHPAAVIYNRALEGVIRQDFRALEGVLSGL